MDFNPSPFYGHIDCKNVISLNGVSKVYGAPSLRLGWIIADSEIIKDCSVVKDWLNISTSVLPQIFATRLLTDAGLIETIRANVYDNRAFINGLLKNSVNFRKIGKGNEGCCMLLEYNFKRQMNSMEFCSAIYDKSNILIVPGDFFGYPYTFRLGFGMECERFKKIVLEFFAACKDFTD